MLRKEDLGFSWEFLRHGIHVHVEGHIFMTMWATEEGLGEE